MRLRCALRAALACKANSSRSEALNAQAVGIWLGCAPEVRAVLAALTLMIEHSSEALRVQNLGMALYGLQGCSSDAPEVRAVLAAQVPAATRATASGAEKKDAF